MPRLLGVDLPGKKRIEYSLRYIYGIGLAKAKEVVAKAGIDPVKRADDLSGEELAKITNVILQSQYRIEGALRR